MIGGSNRPGGMRGGKHGWLSRWMPPFKRYFPRWGQLTPSSYCLDASPLQFPSATWVQPWPPPHNRMRMSQLPQLHPNLRAHQLQAPQAVQFIHPELHHFQYLPHVRYPLCRHSSNGAPICQVPSHPHTEKMGLLSLQLTWWSSQQEDPCWPPRGWG